MKTGPHPSQLTPDEQAADADRARLNKAKAAAHDAYLAAKRALECFDETADPTWIYQAEQARDFAWALYSNLVRETEW